MGEEKEEKKKEKIPHMCESIGHRPLWAAAQKWLGVVWEGLNGWLMDFRKRVTDGRTDRHSYRDARTHLKISKMSAALTLYSSVLKSQIHLILTDIQTLTDVLRNLLNAMNSSWSWCINVCERLHAIAAGVWMEWARLDVSYCYYFCSVRTREKSRLRVG